MSFNIKEWQKTHLRNRLYENFEFLQSGDMTSAYQGETDNLKDFLEAIDRIPDTVQRIMLPNGNTILPEDNWKEDVKNMMMELDKNYDIKSFQIASYYPLSPKETEHPIYIQVETDKSRKFAKDMASGDLGSLD